MSMCELRVDLFDQEVVSASWVSVNGRMSTMFASLYARVWSAFRRPQFEGQLILSSLVVGLRLNIHSPTPKGTVGVSMPRTQ